MINKTNLLFCILICCSLCCSCISRSVRPAIMGYVYDYNNKPVPNCKVGETLTDKDGKFFLEEKRSNRFFLTEIFAMEAPPSFYVITIAKDGYQTYNLDFFDKYGGGRPKGTKDNWDTVYIKQKNQIIKPANYIYTKWKFAANKDLDTLYGTNSNFSLSSPITDNLSFSSKMEYGLDYKFENKVKPDAAWSTESYNLKTTYLIMLNLNGTYHGKKIRNYRNAWKHRMEYERTYRESYTIPSDSVYTNGKFKLANNQIIFDVAFNKSSNIYKIDSIDRDVMILTRQNIKSTHPN